MNHIALDSPHTAAGGRTRRIVVSLLKGGVAKSETAVNLAHGMAMAGLRVLLIDTDVQAQCNDMLGAKPTRGLADVISGWTHAQEALYPARDNLWLLAGGNDLAAVKMEIARREMAPEAVLDETLAQYEGQFDAMVIDTAPGWDTLLVNALYCSREVLSPVSMEPVALSGLIRFEERLEIIKKYNKNLVLKWIVPTFVDGRVKKTGEILNQLRERYGDLVATPIKYSVKLSEAPAFGRTIYEHDPKGVGAQAYGELTQRIIKDAPAGRADFIAPALDHKPAVEDSITIFPQKHKHDDKEAPILESAEPQIAPDEASPPPKKVIELKTETKQTHIPEDPEADTSEPQKESSPASAQTQTAPALSQKKAGQPATTEQTPGRRHHPASGLGNALARQNRSRGRHPHGQPV